MKKFIGVDIGGTNVKFGIVDEKGTLLEKIKYPTAEINKNGEFIINFIHKLDEILKQNTDIQDVGIGVPGTISKDRTSTQELPNIPSLSNTNIISHLRKKFPSINFHLENDANAAALGEYYFGELDLPSHYIFITLGTGVGGAAIIDRKIFKGGDGNGMEIGHIISGSGKTVEAHLGKKGIVKLAKKLLSDYEGKTILKKKNMDAKSIAKAAHKGDPLALHIYEKLGKKLGECIVSGVRILDVKTILIGGGVSETFSYLEKTMYETIYKRLTPYYTNSLSIKIASLKNEAGILGAASLCFLHE